MLAPPQGTWGQPFARMGPQGAVRHMWGPQGDPSGALAAYQSALPNLVFDGVAGGPGNTAALWRDRTAFGNHLVKSSAPQFSIRTNAWHGKTCYVPNTPDIQAGWDLPGSLSLDRQNTTIGGVVCPVSNYNGGGRCYANLGATLLEALLSNYGGVNPADIMVFPDQTTHVVYNVPYPFIFKLGASNVKVWIGNQAAQTVTALASGSSTGGTLFMRNDGSGFSIGGQVFQAFIMAGQITDQQASDYITAVYSDFGLATFTKNLLIEGDSIVEGYNATLGRGWVTRMSEALKASQGAIWRIYSAAVGGQLVFSMNAYADALGTGLYNAGYTKNIATLLGGGNDILAGENAAETTTRILTWHATQRAKGFYTIAQTILPRTAGLLGWTAGMQTIANTVNDNIAAATTGDGVDTVLDHRLNSYLNNSANFPDGTHPDDTGQQHIADGVYAKVVAA